MADKFVSIEVGRRLAAIESPLEPYVSYTQTSILTCASLVHVLKFKQLLCSSQVAGTVPTHLLPYRGRINALAGVTGQLCKVSCFVAVAYKY